MQKFRITTILFFVSILFLSISCADNTVIEKNIADNVAIEVKTKTQKLADQLFKNGNFISTETSPKIISPEEVYNLLDKNIHILDIRSAYDYSNGHIKNAVNLKKTEVIDYAQVKGLPVYDKVIMICYTGQSATYATAILQMLGHQNIYVLEWGMCGWNKKFSKRWEKAISNEGVSRLVDSVYAKNSFSTLPEIQSKKNSGEEILYTRAKAIEKEGYSKSAVDYKFAEANAKKSYLISYQPELVYNKGHLENAIFYDVENSFNLTTNLLSLPLDKTIMVYSNKGYKSTFIMAYLKMLGYDAKTVKYGANSFMNSKLNEFGGAFNSSLIKNYPYEISEYVEEEGGVQEGGC
jgi:rhodanese-related sulfurtransferase